MLGKYYIHKPYAWDEAEVREIDTFFKNEGYEYTVDAARGLGAGGPGWEVPIEIILQVSGVIGLGEQIWKLVKFLHKKKPKKQAPESQSEIYQLIVHIEDKTSIVINLNEDAKETESALSKLDKIKIDEYFHIVQDKDDWNKF